MKDVVSTSNAPAAIGPYSQAIRMGNTLYASGQIPVDPATSKIVEGDATAQATQCCKNVQAVVEAAGYTLEDVVKVTVFITDMANFPLVNEVYKQYFTEPYPARSCVAVKMLPLDALVEIEVLAVKS